MKTHFATGLALIAGVLMGAINCAQAGTTYYVDSVAGVDTNDGQSEASAWKNLYRANQQVLQPGDSLLFKRGGKWRGSLQMQGGSQAGGVVTYGAYGVGEKPSILGSATLNNAGDWVQTSAASQIWVSRPVALDGEKVSNPEFTTNLSGWSTWNPRNIITLERDTSNSSNPSAKVTINPKASGDAISDAQLFAQVGEIVAGKCYRFSFKAVSSQQFAPQGAIALILNNSNGTPLASILNLPAMPTIGTTWDTYNVLYRAAAGAPAGRVAFQFGASATTQTILNIDSVSFIQVDCDRVLAKDVGNLIFDDGASFGVKVYNESDLDQDGKFWFDPKQLQIKIRSYDNPAVLHNQIEAAQNTSLATVKTSAASKSYLVLQDLALRYGGAHGVAFGDGTANVTLQRLDISYIGGSYLGSSTLDPWTRYGNGIQFWNYGASSIVRDNRLSHIYDSALTAQGQAKSPNTVIFSDISFTNNYIANVEQCYELWNQGEGTGSKSERISFTQNTCVNAGHGWSHAQRPGKAGSGVLMYAAIAPMSSITITDNVFYQPTESVVYINLPWLGYRAIDFARNCFYADPNPVPDGGWLLRETGNVGGVPRAVSTTRRDDFIAEFSSAATPDSYYDDPIMQAFAGGVLMPTASRCTGKGYTPPQ